MGIMALRAPAMALPDDAAAALGAAKVSAAKSFALGFVTNALNPKPILFFLSLFSALVSHETPALVKGAYGLVMAAGLVAWFSGVSYFITTVRVRRGFARLGPWLNRLTGAVFIAFGVRLVLVKAEGPHENSHHHRRQPRHRPRRCAEGRRKRVQGRCRLCQQ
jgi:threonine/homoserine/homoserine lactone efflux protein